MSVTIELPPAIEASLAARAQEQGISLAEYLQHLLGGPASAKAAKLLTPAERAEAWIEAAQNLPDTPAIADESRESIYSSRG
jgi:hypothetical protein